MYKMPFVSYMYHLHSPMLSLDFNWQVSNHWCPELNEKQNSNRKVDSVNLKLFYNLITGYLKSKVKSQGRCKGFWRAEKRFRFWIRHTVKAQWFYWFVIVLVFFNTVCVAVEHYDQPEFLTHFLCKFFFHKH